MKSKIQFSAIAIILLVCLQSATGFGQTGPAKTTADSVKSDSVAVSGSRTTTPPASTSGTPVGVSTEIVLEEIKIEAVVETPSVALVPKRLTPDFGKMEFVDRSFEKELKAIPQKPMLTNDDLNKVNKIKSRKANE
jgi:hypothetical protein